MIESILVLILLLLILGAYYPSMLKPFKNALPVPSPPHQRKIVKELLIAYQKELNRQITVVELGSGWGGMGTCASSKEIKFIGVELNLLLFAFSKFKALFYKYPPKYVFGDAYKYNLSEGDVFILFMGKEFNSEFETKVPKGKFIICSYFPLENNQPIFKKNGILVYKT